MILRISIILLWGLVLSSCVGTDILPTRSSPSYAVISEDPIMQSSMAQIDSLASAHCAQYDSTAIFEKKDWSILYRNFYYYRCIKKASIPSERVGSPVTLEVNKQGIESSKKACSELGFKSGTEGFGKCVLQLSK
jgi:hypothetical protein